MSTGAFDCGKKAMMVMEECDRLSDLPDSLIQDILRFLPTRDVILTTILSKRWKKLWTTFPWLDFNSVTMKMGRDEFRNTVDKALKSWRGKKMFRLDVEFNHEVGNDGTDDIDSWLRLAVEKKVEAVHLRFSRLFSKLKKKKLYMVAQNLYSCSSLKQLELRSCDLQIHGNVRWDQLKILRLILCKSVSQNAVDKILRGSPRLESFSLCLKNNEGNFSICSSSLKELSICIIPSMDAKELRISTPNLEYLEIGSIKHGYSKCLLTKNMPLLRFAVLDFRKVPQNVVGELLTQILPVISHVKGVLLSESCIKALGAMKEKRPISSFPNADYLELQAVRCELYELIVSILEMFPQLRDLVFQTNYQMKSSNI